MSGPEIVWLLREVVEAIHDEQIAWHGGSEGIRDAGLLASAIDGRGTSPPMPIRSGVARCEPWLWAGQEPPFVDGNKRTAFVSVETFLLLNRAALVASDAECVLTMEGLAGGTISEAEFGAWIRRSLRLSRP